MRNTELSEKRPEIEQLIYFYDGKFLHFHLITASFSKYYHELWMLIIWQILHVVMYNLDDNIEVRLILMLCFKKRLIL